MLSRRRRSPVLALHEAHNIVETCLRTEGKYGLHPTDLRSRFAVHVGDGAIEGPFGQSYGELFAAACGLPLSRGWGALDDFHAAEKAGSHADYAERGPQGYIHLFHETARKLRSLFGFGVGQIIARAAAKKYHLTWRRPPAPYSQATRTVCYEGRIVEGFCRNFPVAAAALMYRVREAIENAKRVSMNNGHVAGPTCGLLCKDA